MARLLPNVFDRLFLAPVHVNYHTEHHLWPSVPYCNLPAPHRLEDDHGAIVVRRSYLGLLWAYFRCLPLAAPRRAPAVE